MKRSRNCFPSHPRRRPAVASRRSSNLLLLACACLMFSGCYSHSISRNDPSFRGDLSEFQMVNSTVSGPVREADIQRALRSGGQSTVRAPAGSRLLLVQSGASTPDPALVTAMGQHYDVVPFSGLPPNRGRGSDNASAADDEYARQMRLAAAQAGCRYIVCVWGLVDSTTDPMPTKMVSWTPIVGQWIPDETRSSRIRLRAAVIETSSGRWSLESGEPFGSRRITGEAMRKSRATWQQEALKSGAYPDLAARVAGAGE